MAVPGDIISHDGREYIVVDIDGHEPPFAVLRPPDDQDGQLTAAPVADLTVVGHADHIDGWEEISPGKWRKT